jgi:hypothetical protein
MTEPPDDPLLPRVNATTFRVPLQELAETLAQKLKREAPGLMSNVPAYVSTDLFVLLRYAKAIYNFFFYIHTDELREDPFWSSSFTFVAAPLVRSLIDILYNITFILHNPAVNGPAFRKAGFWKELSSLRDETALYQGKPEWDAYLANKRSQLDLSMRSSDIVESQLSNQDSWKTLGNYILSPGPGGKFSDHQLFLKRLTLGNWREYSAMSHAAFEGLLDMAAFYTRDSQDTKTKELVDAAYPRLMSLHLARAAILLLALLTEIQAYFNFPGANIGPRLHQMWNALMQVPEATELYNERYARLMASKGIKPN